MKCPKCQSDNREGVKFCEECGAKFETDCPECKAKIPIGKNFILIHHELQSKRR